MNSRLILVSALCAGVLAGACVPLATAAAPAKAEFQIRNGDRVVFYGDSITDGEWYPTLMETFVVTRYPTWRNHFANRGVSGDNSASIARFERDVIAQKPDLFTYNMGFNDGGYFALQSAQLEKWLANIEKSVALARQANPKVRIALLSPIPSEPTVSLDPRWISRDVYPYVMLSYGHEEEKLAVRLGVPFVDVGLLYGQSMGLGKVAGGAAFELSRDGVHPQREGQTLIAFHALRGLGANPLVASVTLDATKAKLLAAARCKVKDLAVRDGVLSFQRTCESLPYPTPPEARPFAFLVRLEDQLSLDLLTVTGLPAPAYTLFVDDRKIADIAAAELADGVNLSRFPTTPMYEQALAVMDAVRRKQMIECGFWHQFIGTGKADGAGQPTDKATAEDRAAMDTARQAVKDAEAACYALNTPKPHVIRLAPSEAKVARFEALVAAEIQQAPLGLTVTPLEADWNRMTLLGKDVTVTIANSATVARSGTLTWTCPSGWTVEPAQAPFAVEAGKSQKVTFTATAAAGAALMPAPEVAAQWRWSRDWPYPMRLARPIDIIPRLAIAASKAAPGLTGNLDDWKDATAFTLDTLAYVDPAVTGKKKLWGGPADLSGRFFLKWDDTALYAAALIRDNEHVQDAIPMMTWSQDCVMLAFQMRETGKPDARYEFVFAAYAKEDLVQTTVKDPRGLAAGPEIRFKSKVDKDNGTCLYEMVIPWNRLAPFTPAAGREFRFTWCAGEADSQFGKGFNYLAWTHGINYGKNPADFAWLTLRAP